MGLRLGRSGIAAKSARLPRRCGDAYCLGAGAKRQRRTALAGWLSFGLSVLMGGWAGEAVAQGPARSDPPKRAVPAPAKPKSEKPESEKPNNEKPVRADEARGYEQPPGGEPEDAALFVPRVVLAVPRYALKLVFWPVRETIRFIDKHALIEETVDVLYNDERTAAIVPTLALDSFFGPSLGLKAFHEDLGGHDEYASIEALFGGMYSLATQVHFRAEHYAGTRLWLESLARFEGEPGLLFQGIGDGQESASAGALLDPRQGSVATRFSEQRLLALLRAGYGFGPPSQLLQVGVTGIYDVRDFGGGQRGSEPSIESVYDLTQLVGFDDRVPVFEADLNLSLDLRDVKGATTNGLYLEAFAGRAPSLGGPYAFWHHGAELSGYIDLYKRTRVLVLRAVSEAVDGDAARIPFSDLPRLGGPHRLRGYPSDRFREEKSLLGTVEYRYPIHEYVAGALFLDAGRVSPSYSGLFKGPWHVGGGAGFNVRSRDHHLFSFHVAYGDGVQFHLTTSDPLRAFSDKDTDL